MKALDFYFEKDENYADIRTFLSMEEIQSGKYDGCGVVLEKLNSTYVLVYKECPGSAGKSIYFEEAWITSIKELINRLDAYYGY
ncbi:MAG: hypothetical protein J6K26_06255 [Lachnospiraceae bacterium]|nr:hypothetical protein [Lachnospiraceae bacterium]